MRPPAALASSARASFFHLIPVASSSPPSPRLRLPESEATIAAVCTTGALPAGAAPSSTAPAAAAALLRFTCFCPAAWPSSVSRLVQVTLQQLHVQGGDCARN
jgi:hypothetical protein